LILDPRPVWADIFTYGIEPGVPAGPTIDEGSVYLFLAPLSAGSHTIHFKTLASGWDGSPLIQDVTYNLTVGKDK